MSPVGAPFVLPDVPAARGWFIPIPLGGSLSAKAVCTPRGGVCSVHQGSSDGQPDIGERRIRRRWCHDTQNVARFQHGLAGGDEGGGVGGSSEAHGGDAGAVAADVEVGLGGRCRAGAAPAAGEIDGEAGAAGDRQAEQHRALVAYRLKPHCPRWRSCTCRRRGCWDLADGEADVVDLSGAPGALTRGVGISGVAGAAGGRGGAVAGGAGAGDVDGDSEVDLAGLEQGGIGEGEAVEAEVGGTAREAGAGGEDGLGGVGGGVPGQLGEVCPGASRSAAA